MLHLLYLGFALLPLSSAIVSLRQGVVTELSSAEINAFTPFTYFASVAYCHPDATREWSCGGQFICQIIFKISMQLFFQQNAMQI
jgi:hypothetical protein